MGLFPLALVYATERFPPVCFPARNRLVGFRVIGSAKEPWNGTTWWLAAISKAVHELVDAYFPDMNRKCDQ